MRLVALVKSSDHVCCRYRLQAYRPYWQKAGCHLELRQWPQFYLSRRLLKAQLGLPDVLILQRRMPSPWQTVMLKRIAGAVVYDFDDALFLRSSFSPRGLHSERLVEKFRHTIQEVDAVVAGNSFLHEQATMLKDESLVYQIPTCLDTSRYTLAKHRHKEGLQLVWIGSASTLPSLALLKPALEKLGRQWPDYSLKIICDTFLQLDSLKVVACPWAEETETAELAGADIGISWMPDDLWSQGKCGLKVLQYMAAGLPVVANPVGVQCNLVDHGITGFLVETTEELTAAVEMLRRDPTLRHRMGRAGRQRVETEFHVSAGAKLWLQLLRNVGVRSPQKTQ